MEASERWDGIPADELARRWGLPSVHAFAEVGSTNDAARALADRGAPHGTVVVAEAQRAGRGREGRAWSSPPGVGVWMSLVARPVELSAPRLLPLLAGLAASEALDPFLPPALARVKWPNDLWIEGRKVAGILCEAGWTGEGPAPVVVGIGINVLHAPEDFPEAFREGATSLRIASGTSPARAEVAGAVAAALARALARPPAQLTGGLLAALRRRDALEGRRVRVEASETLTGIALGINPAGALLLRGEDGRLRTVTSGTVRPLA